MKLKIQHLKNIIAANNDNRLAIFVGAGISKNSETKELKLPTWNDLISDLKRDLDLKDETDFLKIAQLYHLEFGEHSYSNKIKSYFPDNVQPSLIHKEIFELNPQIIITTNWDSILERAIENNAYIYDVICCDKDLVKSTLQKKVIKMHGDFKNHNFVFKEDDYLNYQYNFPLIENYIKSVMSTHTVLFLGYSYNDINFKQIVKWLQNSSKVQPARYLTVFEEKPTQTKYLENYGIKVLLLNEPHSKTESQKDYFENTERFLSSIKNPEKLELFEKDEDVIDFVWNRLKILAKLNGILLEQIQASLTNCGFIYDDTSKIILEFYDKIHTYDIDSENRNIYKKFVSVLKKHDETGITNSYLNGIFEIFGKANINGVVVTKDDLTNNKEYVVLDEYLDSPSVQQETAHFNFDFTQKNKSTNDVYELLQRSFILFQIKDYEQAYELTERLISECLKKKNHTILFISMFNRNVLLRFLKYGINQDRDKYKNVKEYDLEEKFYGLPKDLQKAVKPVFNFIRPSYLYEYAYEISEELRKKEKSKKTIESGGFVFNSNRTGFSSKHKNLISFVLRNGVMIENFNEFESINKHFLKIALIRQIQKEKTTFSQTELFSAIKYLPNEDLKQLLIDFYKYDANLKGKFEILDSDKKWLISKVLFNISNNYIMSRDVFNKFEEYLENIVFLLSLTKLSVDENKEILDIFKRIVDEATNTIGVYQSIDLFLGNQYHLYSSTIDENSLLNLIKAIINKFANKQYNGHDFHAITRNKISNLYGYAKEVNAIFEDDVLIKKLISSSKELSIDEQLHISTSLILSIYDMASNKIQKEIKKYLIKIDSCKVKEKHDYFIFELHLIASDLKKFNINLAIELEKYFEQFKDSKTFSSVWYTIKSLIDYLIKEKQVSELKPVSEKVEDLIVNFEKIKMPSIF